MIKRLGGGAFGEIYLGLNTTTMEKVALKVESAKTKEPHLLYETKVYQLLHQDANAWDKGIPRVFLYIGEEDYNAMIMELLGPSLEDLFAEKSNLPQSLKTVFDGWIADTGTCSNTFILVNSFIGI